MPEDQRALVTMCRQIVLQPVVAGTPSRAAPARRVGGFGASGVHRDDMPLPQVKGVVGIGGRTGAAAEVAVPVAAAVEVVAAPRRGPGLSQELSPGRVVVGREVRRGARVVLGVPQHQYGRWVQGVDEIGGVLLAAG